MHWFCSIVRALHTVPLAGGTWLNPRIGKEVQAEAVVDLERIRIGSRSSAMRTRSAWGRWQRWRT